MKYYIIWILTYVVGLALVKSSVCITIQRIASTQKALVYTVWVLLGITWASFFITFLGTLLYCQPVNTIWTPALALSGEGKCAEVSTFVIIGHVATVSTIVTDLALVVVPAIMLWNTQMKRSSKIQAFCLLSFASMYVLIAHFVAFCLQDTVHQSLPWSEFHMSTNSKHRQTCSVRSPPRIRFPKLTIHQSGLHTPCSAPTSKPALAASRPRFPHYGISSGAPRTGVLAPATTRGAVQAHNS